MRGYGQFCPVAMAAEVFAERWTPLILRELLHGSRRFGELRLGLPLVSQSLLTQRLRALEHAGVLERRPAGRGWEYHLTPAGEELRPVVDLLGAWGYRWTAPPLRAEDLDPGLVLWFLHRLVKVEALPPRRVVVRFDLRDDPARLWWLVLKRPEVDLCLRDEGFDVDLFVTADSKVLTDAIMGYAELKGAIRQGLVEIDGPRALARAFPDWIGVTAFAPAARPAAGD
jgi:DNA-binding HxlR family transcriptional regulator